MMSRRPKRPVASLTMASTSARCETSALQATAASPISPATRSAPGPFRSATTTLAPSSAKRFAMPSPKPDAAPVTIATLPLRRSMRLLLPFQFVVYGSFEHTQMMKHRIPQDAGEDILVIVPIDVPGAGNLAPGDRRVASLQLVRQAA